MEKLRVGIIGAGGIARSVHLPSLSSIGEVELAAICDCVPERAKELGGQYHIPAWYADYREMLEKETLDAVYVLTQPDQLYRPVLDCLRRQKHVFMEKPMGITLFQAESIRSEALRQNRCVHVGYNRRYIPLVVETVRRFKELTPIQHVSGCFFKDSSPSFYDGCASAFECDVVHVIDLVRHIAGKQPLDARTLEDRPLQEGAPAYGWYSVLRFEDGVSADIRASYRSGGRVHNFELHGEHASAYLSLGFGQPCCEAYILHNKGAQSHSQAVNGGAALDTLRLDGKQLAGSGDYWRYYGYHAESAAFVRRVLEHPLETDRARLEEDVASARLVEMMRRSIF